LKVRIDKSRNAVVVERGASPKIYSESALMHKVKLELRSQGYDVIKKLMHKDAHMVDESQHYIRERNYAWAIYDSEWVIRRTYEDYNAANRNLVLAWESLEED
jgi:DNA-binding LacI/PurR family transcriptional regulator